MCGIIAITGKAPVAARLVDGLRRLEYRGYDSSGVAVLTGAGVERRRAPGKIDRLAETLAADPVDGVVGVAHTRWATHGAPTEANAHPHKAGRVALVHNGIIENHQALRADLEAEGAVFESETDTEVIAQQFNAFLLRGHAPADAFALTLSRLHGAYAVAAIVEGVPDTVFAARLGSPMVVGLGEGERFVASDAIALAPFTRDVIYLEEGDRAIVRADSVAVFDAAGAPVERPVQRATVSADLISKGNHRHFMEKEIHEQPDAVRRTLAAHVDLSDKTPALPADLMAALAEVERVHIVSCGTAFYAGLTASYWLEAIANLPTRCEVASEFRYRGAALSPKDLLVVVTQSGETADTLAALRHAKARGVRVLAVVNVPESSIWREADFRLETRAGPEIGVASTKAFSAQLTALAVLSIAAATARGALTADAARAHVEDLADAPVRIEAALKTADATQAAAAELQSARTILYLGRGVFFPIGLEGALKLKEISYIHAEAFAAGELKHGTIALIEDGTPIVVVAPHDALFEKTLSNIEEVRARRARVILFTDATGAAMAEKSADRIVEVPAGGVFTAGLIAATPLHLLAYQTALLRGEEIDTPRNLAKSVTVE